VVITAKVTGITTSVSVDDSGGSVCNISNDIQSFDISTPRGVIDVTGLDKSAPERLLGLADGSISIKGTFNSTASMSHAVFSTVASSIVTRTVTVVYPGPKTLNMEVVFTDYQLSHGADGSLTYTATGQVANGAIPAWT
jgi:predicted secreted protein